MTEVFLEGNVENAALSRQHSAQLEPFVVKQALKTHFCLRPPLCTVQDAGDFDDAFADAINGKEGQAGKNKLSGASFTP